jgi:tetratricopeptide (TPR) repeat protein
MLKTILCYSFFGFVFVFTVCSCTHVERGKTRTREFLFCEEADAIYTVRKRSREVTKKVVLKKCNNTKSFDRGKNLAVVERWKEALIDFKADLDENPQDAYAHFNLGVAYEANGLFQNALIEYDKAFGINPKEGYFQQAWKRAKESMEELR